MSFPYPKGPESYPQDRIKPSMGCRIQAWLAMGSLLLFLMAYAAASGWLIWKTWGFWYSAFSGAEQPVNLVLLGAATGFLAGLMIKALFFRTRHAVDPDTEIKEQDHPELFAFLRQLARDARAPQPRHVYLTGQMHAEIFFDVSLLNLVVPTRKHLEIGLPLINTLNLSEFKAVLAHEFGHFAQRTAGAGRWVYVAHRIAEQIVTRKDAFDALLDRMTRCTFIIPLNGIILVIGWVLKLIAWALRAVVETFFRIATTAERAFSREREFQADRIAFSLTGSEALIHALFRMPAAETAWQRTLAFATMERARGRVVPDLFALHRRTLEHLRDTQGDPAFGVLPAPGQRVFQPEKITVSQMWSAHPLPHERETQARLVPVVGEQDDRPTWVLFRDPDSLKEAYGRHLLQEAASSCRILTREEALADLEREFDRESCHPRYRGRYLRLDVTRGHSTLEELVIQNMRDEPENLYSDALAQDLAILEKHEKERPLLEALRDGLARNAEGRLMHRGKPVRSRREASDALMDIQAFMKSARQRIDLHDRACRATFHALALEQGNGWEDYWLGLLKLLHYAEHTLATLQDAHQALSRTQALAATRRKMNRKLTDQLLAAAEALHKPLSEVPRLAQKVLPDAFILERLGQPDWPRVIGEWSLEAPTRENLSEWLSLIDRRTRTVTNALSQLKRVTLDRLLTVERQLGEARARRASLGQAPLPTQILIQPQPFEEARERLIQKQRSAWTRFAVADGWLLGTVRFAVASLIVASLAGMSTFLGKVRMTAYNGLDTPVTVKAGWESHRIAPLGQATFSVPAYGMVKVTARTPDGHVIESFNASAPAGKGQYVYNVATATTFIAWTATYGSTTAPPEKNLGAPRWFSTSADVVLQPPPQQLDTRSGEGEVRTVLSAVPSTSARALFSAQGNTDIRQNIIRAHALWDAPDSRHLSEWLWLAFTLPDSETIFRSRLARNPMDIQTLRMEQEQPAPAGRAQAIERHRQLQAQHPDNPDLVYLLARALPDPAQRNAAYIAGHQKHPANGWFAYAAGDAYAEQGDWSKGRKAYEVALAVPALSEASALAMGRLRRLEAGPEASLADLLDKSEQLKYGWQMEHGRGQDPIAEAYTDLAMGWLSESLAKAQRLGQPPPQLVRLLAASDGATPELIRMADAYPLEVGLDRTTYWCTMGLSLRRGGTLRESAKKLGENTTDQETRTVAAYLDALESTKDPIKAAAYLQHVQITTRAQAYTVALVAFGDRVPAEWREFTKRVLFAGERPYFR